jgi:hypothetical protein
MDLLQEEAAASDEAFVSRVGRCVRITPLTLLWDSALYRCLIVIDKLPERSQPLGLSFPPLRRSRRLRPFLNSGQPVRLTSFSFRVSRTNPEA